MAPDLFSQLTGRRGHFRMESGYHSEQWFDLDRLFDDAVRLQPFVDDLARRLAVHRPQAICSPMAGGAKLAGLAAPAQAFQVSDAERFATPGATGLFPISYRVPAAQRDRLRDLQVAIVDDAVSAGSAVKGTHTDLLACGARPVACGALIIFGNAADELAAAWDLKLESVTRLKFGMWRPEECPLCRSGLPVESFSDGIQGGRSPGSVS